MKSCALSCHILEIVRLCGVSGGREQRTVWPTETKAWAAAVTWRARIAEMFELDIVGLIEIVH